MSFEIRYVPAVEDDLRKLRTFEIRRIMDAIDTQLATAPEQADRVRKRLARLKPPWSGVEPVWQLRVGDFRVFYDIEAKRRVVTIRAIRHKGRLTTEDIL
jgi:mRNA-degrading endonuclease RelE of RelBE toxin-antitoxin system